MASRRPSVRQTAPDKRQHRPQPAPATLTDIATLAPATGQIQRTVDNPRAAQPRQILALQRQYGNQAVHHLLRSAGVQARLTVGPASDAYEQEADRVASQVLRQTAPTAPKARLQRAAEEDAPLAQDALGESMLSLQRTPSIRPGLEEQVLAQTGGGHPLPTSLRETLEPRFGADFSGVRLHTDHQVATLNRQINAEAFTHGQDIFIGAGHYAPGTPAGQHLLAHELTHTLQQTGGVQRRVKASVTPAPARIQRLASRQDFEELAGGTGFFEGLGAGTYKKILQGLDQYQQDKKPETLDKLATLVESWLAAHKHPKSNDDKRRAIFMPGLLREVNGLRHKLTKEKGTLPSQYKEQKEEAQSKARTGLEDVNKDRESVTKEPENTNVEYVLRVNAAVDMPDYLQFAQKRTELTVQSRRKFWQKRRSNDDIKKEAAKSVIESKEEFKTKTQEEKDKAIQYMVDNSYAVGHTWVKFITRANGKPTSDKSFGFWPLAYFASPTGSVPGRVKHPDASENDHKHLIYKDYTVKHGQYLDGLARAYGVMQSPPAYKLIDYNCTKFALDVANAAGVDFPANAFMRVPVAATLGLTSTEAYNPNALFSSMEKDPTAVDPKKQAEKEKKEREERVSRQEAVTLTPYSSVGGERGIPLTANRFRADQFSIADEEYQPKDPAWVEIVLMGDSGAEQFVVKRAEYETFMRALREGV